LLECLFEEICGEETHVRFLIETESSGEIANALMTDPIERHDFNNVESCPRHVISQKLEINQFLQRFCFVIRITADEFFLYLCQALANVFCLSLITG